ncbi:MAG: hypothetical protein HFH30_12205, partial [Eubacterium sp.]|nr:hypothetical protein [Eubacterium sp.]
CHDREVRTPNLYEARMEILKKLGQKKLAQIDDLSEQILKGYGKKL